MEAENFAGCNSAEIHEVDLKSYPGERALGVYFCGGFVGELQEQVGKH